MDFKRKYIVKCFASTGEYIDWINQLTTETVVAVNYLPKVITNIASDFTIMVTVQIWDKL